MERGRNFLGSFGDSYYRSADYRTRYPAYLRQVVPPPPMTINVQDMLFPKRFGLQKVAIFTETVIDKPPKAENLECFNEIKMKRKTARKQKRLRSETPVQEKNDRNDTLIPLMVAENGTCAKDICLGTGIIEEIDTFESRDSPDQISLLKTKDDHVHQYPSDLIPFPILPIPVETDHEPTNNLSSIPTSSSPPPPPPPPLPTTSEEYYPSQHISPFPPPPPLPGAEEDNKHKNILPSSDYSSPPTPQQLLRSPGVHFGSGVDDKELLNPIEQCKRTAKRFQRECHRRRHLVAYQEEKSQARTIAEEAKNIVMAVKIGDKDNRTSDDETLGSKNVLEHSH